MNGDSDLEDYVKQLISTGRDSRGAGWYDTELEEYLDGLSSMMLSADFGIDGAPAAIAVNSLLNDAPHLLSRGQYFILGPQAGAHLAAYLADAAKGIIGDEMRRRLFLIPFEEFRIERKDMPEGLVDAIDGNFELCFTVLLIRQFSYARERRNQTTERYNELIRRLRWDHQNSYRIRLEMRGLLEADQVLIDELTVIDERCRQLEFSNESRHKAIQDIRNAIREWQEEVVGLRSRV